MLLLIFCCLTGYGSAEENSESPARRSQLLVDKGGSMVGRRSISIEPGMDYTHISTNQLDITGFSVLPNLVVGLIQVQKTRRDILVPSLTIRAGVTNAFEVNLRIPYTIRYDRVTLGAESDETGPQSERIDENGIGDIEGGFLIHLLKEKESRPQVLFGFKVKSRTGKDPYGLGFEEVVGKQVPTELPLGSGHWALEPSLTLVKTADPAVLFFNLGYFIHLKRDIHNPGIGTVDPGDSINYSFGMAYALNDKFALSTAFEQKFFTKTEQEVSRSNFEKIPNTDITLATLSFGGTYIFTDNLSANLSVGIGLTEDSPDFQVGLKFPMRYTGL